MHRFFLNSEDQIQKNKVQIRNLELIHQLKNVLRFKTGESIILINNQKSTDLEVKLSEINKSEINADIINETLIQTEPQIKLNLFFPILKNISRIEFILQKCTEIGVTQFTPLITDRTEKPILPKIERLHRIIKEASEQSQRTFIPTINPPFKFSTSPIPKGINIIAEPDIKNTLPAKFNNQAVNLFIGPEGGFTNEEIQYATNSKFLTINLGKLILRAETACIVASAKILI